ncbi:MAG TPA: hypothetical protein VFC83_01480 [Erysipelotrichaceae bacterium]|nr:hypothetical protein [Erysipelotrichaceae bacterium]
MKKIAFITTNKLLGEGLQSTIEASSIRNIEFILLLNPKQVILDAKVLEIDVALVDMTFSESKYQKDLQNDLKCLLCDQISTHLPKCRIILLVSQHDKVNRNIALQAKQENKIDDFVFYDSSLKYLIAKLSTI